MKCLGLYTEGDFGVDVCVDGNYCKKLVKDKFICVKLDFNDPLIQCR
jgi:hypothetical protein